MKKGIFKLIWNRFKSKTPKGAKAASYIAAVLIVVFFGADQMYDICDIAEMLCNNKELIYSILIIVAGGSHFSVDKKAKK